MRAIHKTFSIIAFLTILIFFSSTVFVELFLEVEQIALLKKLIAYALFLLVISMMIAGATGNILSKNFPQNQAVIRKRKRMIFIALNGLFVLIPSAIFLYYSSSDLVLDSGFYAVQTLELIAGFVNLSLLFLNLRDGKRIYQPDQV